MTTRFTHIAEANHRSHNPLTTAHYHLLGEICGFEEKQRVLDLACGKGEGLVQWALEFNVVGVGVDASAEHIAAAQERAYKLDVGNTTNFVVSEAADYPEDHHAFDYVSFMGSAWLGNTLPARLDKLRMALKPRDGLLLLGETYWRQAPTQAVCDALGVEASTFLTLTDLLQVVTRNNGELVEMVLAEQHHIDRYESQQWMAVSQFLNENADDADAPELQGWINANRQMYLTTGRDYLGWGVFVIRPASAQVRPSQMERQQPGQPIAVDFDSEMIWVSLADGRIIGNPLQWYPRLMAADATSRQQAELRASSIHWFDLGLTLSIQQMLQGRG